MEKRIDWISMLFYVLLIVLSFYFIIAQINSNIIRPCEGWSSGCYADVLSQSGSTLLFLLFFPVAMIVILFVLMKRIIKSKFINNKILKINLLGLIILILAFVLSSSLTISCFYSGGEKCMFNFLFLVIGYILDIVLIVYSLSFKK